MIIYGGASKTGKAHLRSGLPNQDAYAVAHSKRVFAVAVSDGLGSRENSQVGARAAVKSAAIASRIVNAATCGADIIRLVHAIWRTKLVGFDAQSCACTCLFAMKFDNGRLFAAALGDGIIAIENDGKQVVLELKEKDFANSTDALDTCKLDDWRFYDDQILGDYKLMLATDGISDDIEEGEIFNFADFVIVEVEKQNEQRKRNGYIKKLMSRWTRPYSNDDKTLVVVKEDAEKL